MTPSSEDQRPLGAGGTRGLAVRDAGALVFAADMYGIQLDQLARLTGGERSARAASGPVARARVCRVRPAESRRGLALGDPGGACGLRAGVRGQPTLSRLAHIRAVAAARAALEATSGYQAASAFWRCERRIRSRHGVGVRQHLPDGEVHWPDGACGPDGAAVG